jgi:hypothetical protein
MIDKHKIQNMALDVSYRCEWDGEDICAVFLEALTDANYHTLREILEEIIKKEFEEYVYKPSKTDV